MFTSKMPDYKLNKRTADIWLCHSGSLSDSNTAFLALLSTEEQARAQRFKFDIHREQFIAFHGFMRVVLAKYLDIDPVNVLYQKGDKGKPFIDMACSPEHSLQFNLSHTQDVAILAVMQEAEVGVDVEHIDRKTDWKGICKRFFTEPEQQALFSLKTPEEQELAFYELWTRKEAYMKVLGTGLSLSPTEFTLTVPPEAPALVQHHAIKYQPEASIEFKTLSLPDSFSQFRATLAAASAIHECRYFNYSCLVQ